MPEYQSNNMFIDFFYYLIVNYCKPFSGKNIFEKLLTRFGNSWLCLVHLSFFIKL